MVPSRSRAVQRANQKDVVYLRMAAQLATLATCSRLTVGCVLTDINREQVWAGYNGDHRGGYNRCASEVPGSCGCLHAEDNAVLKAPHDVQKRAYVTHAPCRQCASRLIQSRVQSVYYVHGYRVEDGLDLLRDRRVSVQQLAI